MRRIRCPAKERKTHCDVLSKNLLGSVKRIMKKRSHFPLGWSIIFYFEKPVKAGFNGISDRS